MSAIVARARELLAEITPGQWEMRPDADGDPTSTSASVHSGHRSILTSADGYHYGYADTHDAEFIAAAPRLVKELADRIEAAESLLRELVDTDDCWFDHNGDCQAHGFFDGPCAHEQAKQFLGAEGLER